MGLGDRLSRSVELTEATKSSQIHPKETLKDMSQEQEERAQRIAALGLSAILPEKKKNPTSQHNPVSVIREKEQIRSQEAERRFDEPEPQKKSKIPEPDASELPKVDFSTDYMHQIFDNLDREREKLTSFLTTANQNLTQDYLTKQLEQSLEKDPGQGLKPLKPTTRDLPAELKPEEPTSSTTVSDYGLSFYQLDSFRDREKGRGLVDTNTDTGVDVVAASPLDLSSEISSESENSLTTATESDFEVENRGNGEFKPGDITVERRPKADHIWYWGKTAPKTIQGVLQAAEDARKQIIDVGPEIHGVSSGEYNGNSGEAPGLPPVPAAIRTAGSATEAAAAIQTQVATPVPSGVSPAIQRIPTASTAYPVAVPGPAHQETPAAMTSIPANQAPAVATLQPLDVTTSGAINQVDVTTIGGGSPALQPAQIYETLGTPGPYGAMPPTTGAAVPATTVVPMVATSSPSTAPASAVMNPEPVTNYAPSPLPTDGNPGRPNGRDNDFFTETELPANAGWKFDKSLNTPGPDPLEGITYPGQVTIPSTVAPLSTAIPIKKKKNSLTPVSYPGPKAEKEDVWSGATAIEKEEKPLEPNKVVFPGQFTIPVGAQQTFANKELLPVYRPGMPSQSNPEPINKTELEATHTQVRLSEMSHRVGLNPGPRGSAQPQLQKMSHHPGQGHQPRIQHYPAQRPAQQQDLGGHLGDIGDHITSAILRASTAPKPRNSPKARFRDSPIIAKASAQGGDLGNNHHKAQILSQEKEKSSKEKDNIELLKEQLSRDKELLARAQHNQAINLSRKKHERETFNHHSSISPDHSDHSNRQHYWYSGHDTSAAGHSYDPSERRVMLDIVSGEGSTRPKQLSEHDHPDKIRDYGKSKCFRPSFPIFSTPKILKKSSLRSPHPPRFRNVFSVAKRIKRV